MRTLTTVIVALATSGTAAAATDFTDTARVISTTPITERVVEPRQECTTENTPAPQERTATAEGNRSYAGAIIGGVAGALLGHQVGKGRGNTAATAAGAIAGSVIGDRIDNRQTVSAPAYPVERCRTVETTREVVKGYTVVYRYNGRDVATTLPYDPGQTVRVGVGVVDEHRQGAVPAGNMTGSAFRDAEPAPPVTTIPVSSRPAGRYSYRY